MTKSFDGDSPEAYANIILLVSSLHIVSDRFWLWNSTDDELETRSIMFAYASDASPSYDLVIGG